MAERISPEEISLSPVFRQRISSTFDQDGRNWLANLPELLKSCEKRWRLRIDRAVNDLSYNYVAPATGEDGRQVILKLGVPNHELSREVMALREYNGRGSARLIDADPQAGIMLLERLTPGRMLSELCPDNDKEATRIAARVMRGLWRPAVHDHPYQTVASWGEGLKRLRDHFQGGTGFFPTALVEEAEEIYQLHLATTETEVLLHGDLHHYNILSAEREPWLAIDPKGVVGDPAYEAGALLRNPLDIFSWPDLGKIQSRRLDILAEELQIERQRLKDWAVAQIVLSAWWSFEDEGDEELEWVAFAEQTRSA